MEKQNAARLLVAIGYVRGAIDVSIKSDTAHEMLVEALEEMENITREELTKSDLTQEK